MLCPCYFREDEIHKMFQWFIKNKKAIIVLVIGIIFIWIGTTRSEDGIVFMKAVRICMECIGIG